VGTWATLETARRAWPDAPSGTPDDDDLLTQLLEIARDKVLTFGPLLADPDAPPDGWDYAQTLAARDVWQAARRDGDFIGFDTYAIRVRPLSADAQAIVRPYKGTPSVN